MPQQMVGPGAWLSERIHVGAPEEVGLHVHLLDVEIAGCDLLMDPLVAGLNRRVWPHIATSPVVSAKSATACASARGIGERDSTCTCLPAFRQAIDCAACIWVGVHRMTASTSFRAKLSARSVAACAIPYLSAIFAGRFEPAADQGHDLDAIDVLDAVGACSSRRRRAAPCDFDGLVTSVVLEDQLADCGVAGRNTWKKRYRTVGGLARLTSASIAPRQSAHRPVRCPRCRPRAHSRYAAWRQRPLGR